MERLSQTVQIPFKGLPPDVKFLYYNGDLEEFVKARHKIMNDAINPDHYKGKNGMEVIDVIEGFGMDESWNLANVIKYVLRSDKKGDRVEQLKKARWYLDREIQNVSVNDQTLDDMLKHIKKGKWVAGHGYHP